MKPTQSGQRSQADDDEHHSCIWLHFYKAKAGKWLMRQAAYFLLSVLAFIVLWCIFEYKALPAVCQKGTGNWQANGTIFLLYIILTFGVLCGLIARSIELPCLFGQLLFGILLRNASPPFNFGSAVDARTTTLLRSTAFSVILVRAGLAIDIEALRNMKGACLRLAAVPCLVETVVSAVMVKLIFGYHILYGVLLGFVLGAVSPAVCVPCMLDLQTRGLGTHKGIPTLVIAASSIDDVLAITGFAIVFSFIFATGNIVWIIGKAVIELLAGIGVGVAFGCLLWSIPPDHNSTNQRFALVCLLSLTAKLGGAALGIDGAGTLACLILALTANYKWSKQRGSIDIVAQYFDVIWIWPFQPLLFGLIGNELDMRNEISLDILLQCLIILVVALVMRTLAAWIVVFGNNRTWKERLFVAIAWLSKATVQAALASVFLDHVQLTPKPDAEQVKIGNMIVSIGVLSIVLTAPLGAALMRITAPHLLSVDVSRRDINLQDYNEVRRD